MGKYFGTDGIRGKFGDAHMNPDFAYRVGVALGRFIKGLDAGESRAVVIGRDTRQSGKSLSDAITHGLNTQGLSVEDAGVVPTPAVALAIIKRGASMGIAITASHNPAQDNGIKLFNTNGHKLDTDTELEIERLIDQAEELDGEPQALDLVAIEGKEIYVDSVSSLMPEGSLNDWSIVLDTANGATFETSPAVFKHWGAQLHSIGNQPDGININAGVGSEYPKPLSQSVLDIGAKIGIAHDGDGDRLVVSDETGAIVDGDVLLGIYALDALETGKLKNDTLITTIQSNLGLDAAVRSAGGTVERVDIGDRNVAQRMRSLGSNVGGENSGHIIFSDHASTGDGLLAAVKLIQVMKRQGKPLSELAKSVQLFPQETLNLKVEEKLPLDELAGFSATIKDIETGFGEDGRVLVRYSGTEPKLRLLVEGKDQNAVKEALNALETAARVDLSVIDG
ncbi:MAG: phosphoglucosamine mutase [Opitutaceae bacterium]